MEPIALNDSVAKFIKPQTVTRGLKLTVYEALELLKTHPYLVILNDHGHPQGIFTLECLGDGDHKDLSLTEINLQPLPAIASQTTIRDFLDRLCQYEHSASIWAVVDRRNQYFGVIEVLPLIRRMAQTFNNQSLRQFISLIEQLPFPVLLCDHNYEVMGENQLWQQEFTDIQWQGNCLIKSSERTWQITPTDLNGDLSGFRMAIAQDYTSQEHLAQELSDQNADLVKLNRIKDEFIACISHELKTPLTSVIGMASLLSTESIGDLNARQKRYVSMIYQNGRHLTFMIDNVMDLAKAETGQLQLDPEVVSVQEICQQSILKAQKLLPQDPSSPQSTTLDIALDIDPKVKNLIADAIRLQQMLINLLSNAIKFSEYTPQVSLSVQMWEGWIAMTVSDRGIGIPKDKQHLIFQKFQQLENILTRKYDGVGLGLVLTRHLARLHGGDITFISQVGKGSEFTILLPPTPPSLLGISEPIRVSSSQLVLIVENIPEDIESLISVLIGLGYRVVIARSGTEALEKARKLQPSLICLNPDLPVLSGWDVLSLLKKDPVTAGIKVLMTVNANLANISAEADWYVSKPIQAHDLDFLKAIVPSPTTKITILNIGESHTQTLNLLQRLGHQVITATDISQAEVLGKIWQPKLVLLDYPIAELSVKLARISRSILKSLAIVLIHESNQNPDQNLLKEELNIYTQFPDLNLHFLNQLNSQKLSSLIQKAVKNLQSLSIILCNFNHTDKLTQPLFQYLLMAGFTPQVLGLEQFLAGVKLENVDFILIKLNLDHENIYNQICNILNAIAIPIIIINEGSNNRLNLEQGQQSITILDHTEAITLMIPTLRHYLSKL